MCERASHIAWRGEARRIPMLSATGGGATRSRVKGPSPRMSSSKASDGSSRKSARHASRANTPNQNSVDAQRNSSIARTAQSDHDAGEEAEENQVARRGGQYSLRRKSPGRTRESPQAEPPSVVTGATTAQPEPGNRDSDDSQESEPKKSISLRKLEPNGSWSMYDNLKVDHNRVNEHGRLQRTQDRPNYDEKQHPATWLLLPYQLPCSSPFEWCSSKRRPIEHATFEDLPSQAVYHEGSCRCNSFKRHAAVID